MALVLCVVRQCFGMADVHEHVMVKEDGAKAFSASKALLLKQGPSNGILYSGSTLGPRVRVGDGANQSQLVYVPDRDFSGVDDFVYEVINATPGSSAYVPGGLVHVGMTVLPSNDSPKAANDYYKTLAGQPVSM